MKPMLWWSWVRNNWITVAASAVLGLCFMAVLRFQLFSLNSGVNPHERLPAAIIVEGETAPWEIGALSPYYMVVGVVNKVMKDPTQSARLTSAMIGLFAVVCFCWLLQLWFSSSTALLGGILLASSSWYLTIARLGAPYILLVATPLALLVATMLLISSKRKTMPFILLSATAALAMYAPYMCWLVAFGCFILFARNTYLTFKIPTAALLLGSAVFTVLVTPLIIAVVREPEQLRTLIGIPTELPGVFTYLERLINIPLALFVRAPHEAGLHLGSLPYLDLFSSVMFVLGAHYYWLRRKLKRSVVLLGSLVAGSVLIALSPNYQANLTLLIAPAFILITTGVFELLRQWLVVFPRNPIARSIGLACALITVASVSFYHLNRYFIAWPNAPETKDAYQSVTME